MSAVAGRTSTRRLRTNGGDLLSEEVVRVIGNALSTFKRASIAKDVGVELGVGHDLERRVETQELIMAHEHGGRSTALGNGHALVAASDCVDEPA